MEGRHYIVPAGFEPATLEAYTQGFHVAAGRASTIMGAHALIT